MTISDLNPIQFWPIAKQTFNEKVEAGIEPCRFILTPYKNDKVRLQVRNATAPLLVAFVVDHPELTTPLVFTETSMGSGIWEAEFTGADFGGDYHTNLTGYCVEFKFGDFVNFLTNPSFAATLAPWTSVAGPGPDWSWDASNAAKVSISPPGDTSDPLRETFTKRNKGLYSFRLVNSVNVGGGCIIYVKLYNDGLFVSTVFFDSLTPDQEQFFYASGDFNSVEVSAQGTAIFDTDLLVASCEIKEFVTTFKSDLIYFSDQVFGTQLLQYSNANDYAGISYAAAEKFCLRVPAKFYEEREPEEDESEALSDSTVVKLSGTVKRQKFLEIEPLPPYMIFKLKLILKHNSLKVDEDYYIQEEAMDVSKLNDRFALFISKVWLTLRDEGYFTNVYGASVSLNQTSGLPDPMSDYTSGVTYFGAPEAASIETYLGSPEPSSEKTFMGGSVDEGGETYIGSPESAHDETYLGGAVDEDGGTYIGAPQSANAELVFADGTENSELTYIGDPNNNTPGYGCIINPCGFDRVDVTSILWDGGDRMIWDDGDNVDNE